MTQGFLARLRELESVSVGAGALREAIEAISHDTKRRIFGSTVLRFAIQQLRNTLSGTSEAELSSDECERIFAIAIRQARGENIRLFALRDDLVVTRSLSPSLVWKSDAVDPYISERFDDLVRKNYNASIDSPSEDDIANLRTSAALLSSVIPSLSASSLAHVHSIALFSKSDGWQRTASSSEYRLGGTVFLSRTHLSDPWWAAEHLLHESLHQQYYDFIRTHDVYNSVSGFRTEVCVRSIWNLNSGSRWDTHRAMAAFHVYAILSVFYIIVGDWLNSGRPLSTPVSESYVREKIVTCLQKAFHLRDEIEAKCEDHLGLAGKAFFRHFCRVVEFISRELDVASRRVNLRQQRFIKEAGRLRSALRVGEIFISSSTLRKVIADERSSFLSLLQLQGDASPDQLRFIPWS